jgi:glycosyltransferase involved in cell wall biosynthesis
LTKASPALSIGLAVRNGRNIVGRCIDSVLRQDFADFEFVICDNVSDDGTIELLQHYASTDRRVKFSVNPVNVGIHENMRRVLDLSQGTFFRWISADDWLEPNCLATCINALNDRRDAIGATTWFNIHTPDGALRYEEFSGEFPDSSDPATRFERMLWFFHAGDAKYDPMYGVYRRAQLARNRFPYPSERTDWLAVTELALAGPIINVSRRLTNRTRDYFRGGDPVAFRQRLDPTLGEQLKTSATKLYRELYALAISANLSQDQLRRCRTALQRFWIKEQVRHARSQLSSIRRRIGGAR